MGIKSLGRTPLLHENHDTFKHRSQFSDFNLTLITYLQENEVHFGLIKVLASNGNPTKKKN